MNLKTQGKRSFSIFKWASALALSILIVMSQPIAYAKPVSVVADRVGDEFTVELDPFTFKTVMSVGRRDPWYISFIDVINVRMRTSKDSLLMTWHVLGEILTSPDEDWAREESLNFAYFIWMSSTEEGLLRFPHPEDFPWVVVIMGYTYTISHTDWWSYVLVATSPSEWEEYSLNFTIRKRSLDASIPLSILPFTEFYWMGGTTYQNRILTENLQSLHDLTSFAYLG